MATTNRIDGAAEGAPKVENDCIGQGDTGGSEVPTVATLPIVELAPQPSIWYTAMAMFLQCLTAAWRKLGKYRIHFVCILIFVLFSRLLCRIRGIGFRLCMYAIHSAVEEMAAMLRQKLMQTFGSLYECLHQIEDQVVVS